MPLSVEIKQRSVIQEVQIVDAGNIIAGHNINQAKVTVRDLIMVNMVGGGAHHQGAVRCECAAVEQFLAICFSAAVCRLLEKEQITADPIYNGPDGLD